MIGQLSAIFTLTDQLSPALKTMATNAEASFNQFTDSSARVGQAIAATNRIITEFSGLNIATKANEYAVAIENVGGVAKLTAQEQAQVNQVMTDFIAKAEAMGQSVPQQFRDIADATAGAKASVSDLGEVASKTEQILGALGVGLSVEGLVELSQRALESAHQIEVLSDRVGVSADTIQTWQYISNQTGTSIDTFTRSVEFMNKTLGEGTTKTQQVLESIGLDFETIRQLAPEEAFNAIVEAIRQIPDPMLQAEAAVRLFGRTGQELLPAIRDGMQGIAADAPKMSDAMVESLARARREQVLFQAENDRVVSGLTDAGIAVINFVRDLDDLASVDLSKLAGYLGAIAGASAGPSAALPKVSGPTAFAAPTLKPLAANFDDLDASVKKLEATVGDAAKPVAALIDKLSGADTSNQIENTAIAVKDVGGASKVAADELPGLASWLQKVSDAGYTIPPALQAVIDRAKQMADISKAAADTTAYWNEVGKAIEDAAGVDKARQMLVLADAVQTLGGADALTRDETANFDEKIKALKVSQDQLNPTLVDVTNNVYSQGFAMDAMNAKLTSLEGKSLASMFPNAKAGAESFKLFMDSMAPAKQKTSEWDVALRQVTDDFRSMASVTTGTMSLVADDLAKATQATKTFGDSISLLGKGPGSTDANGNIIGGAAGVANIIGGITGVIGAVVSLGSAIASALGIGQTAGRDLVVQFADAQGGFDSLHAKLGELGDEGERMWKRLAAVGQNDPLGAQSAIAQVNQDLKVIDFADAEGGMDELHRKLDALGPAGEQMWQVLQSGGPAAVSMIDHAKDALGSMSQSAQNIAAVMGEGPQDALKDLNSDISKYKVSIDQLGPAWKQQNLTVEAQDLIGSYTRLTDAGVKTTDVISDMSGIVTDTNGKITGFSGGLNQLLNDAISTGAALPDQFQPILQQMVDMGDAVDSNGNKIKDLSGVKFDQSLDQQFKTLIDHIDDLIKKLTDGLNPALLNIPSPTVTVGVNYDYGNGPIPPGAKGGLAADTGNAGSSDSGNSDPSQWGVPVGDSPLTSVTKSGLVYLKPGDIYGMPHLTAGLGAGVSTSAAPLAGSSGGGQMASGVSVQFGDVYISGVATSDPKAFADAFISHVSGAGSAQTRLVTALSPVLRQRGVALR